MTGSCYLVVIGPQERQICLTLHGSLDPRCVPKSLNFYAAPSTAPAIQMEAKVMPPASRMATKSSIKPAKIVFFMKLRISLPTYYLLYKTHIFQSRNHHFHSLDPSKTLSKKCSRLGSLKICSNGPNSSKIGSK